MRIGIISATDAKYWPVFNLTSAVNARYAIVHGYHPINSALPDLTWPETVWQKIPVLRKELSRYDWLLWIDADAMVMNHLVKIERLIDQSDPADLVITEDCHGLNTGVILIRNCEWSHKFLEEVDVLKPAYMGARYPEQEAMSSVLNSLPNIGHMYSIPRWLLNMFWVDYREGDFIIHHAGGSVQDKVKGLTPFLDKVQYATSHSRPASLSV